MNRRKPRNRSVTIDLGEAKSVRGLSIRPDGALQLFDVNGVALDAVAGSTELSYDRPKGPKIISRVPATGSTFLSHPHSTLFNLDRLFCIDTNSRVIDGEMVHAAAVILAVPRNHGNGVLISYRPTQGFEFRGETDRPEAFAWAELMARLVRDNERARTHRVSLVVDSYLDQLEGFNGRSTPVWGSFVLPPNFVLQYASAEIGTAEIVQNRLMRECDTFASRLLMTIESGASPGYWERSILDGRPVRFYNWTERPNPGR